MNNINQVIRIIFKLVLDKYKPTNQAKNPRLVIQNGSNNYSYTYPLKGDCYRMGKGSTYCDIVIDNPLVSHFHCTLQRNPRKTESFIVIDEGSKNRIYVNKKPKKSFPLVHGNTFYLGNPALKYSVKITYLNPPPLWLFLGQNLLKGGAVCVFLLTIWLVIELLKIEVNSLPDRIGYPNVILAQDGKTSLNPAHNYTHKELDKLDDFSPYLIKALIAKEDKNYWFHLGFDPIAIIRAYLINKEAGEIKQGASTITQQLARSLFLEDRKLKNDNKNNLEKIDNYSTDIQTISSKEKTYRRKIKELIIALKLEFIYSKSELLKTYLNRVYLGTNLGSNLYGFEDAAQFYFDKSARDLDLTESATLVGMLTAPNANNPLSNPEKAKKQCRIVVKRMIDLGKLKPEDYQGRSYCINIKVSPKTEQSVSQLIAPYFQHTVRQELIAILGEELFKQGNWIVETALNLNYQQIAEKTLNQTIDTQGKRLNISQGAIVSLNTSNGEIIALVGGKNYRESQWNHVTQAQRQPGSTFKVFAYATALEQGISPLKNYSCSGLRWQGQPYKPCIRSSGNIDIYRGLAQSENVVALRIAQDVGLNTVIEMAKRLGIKSPLESIPGLIIGEKEVNLLEITGAYATFANLGEWNRPHAIVRIRDGSYCQADTSTGNKNPNNTLTNNQSESKTQGKIFLNANEVDNIPQMSVDNRPINKSSITKTGEGIFGKQTDFLEDKNDYQNCQVVYEFGDGRNETKSVIKPDVANTMTKLMQGVVRNGTGSKARLGLGEAGKTGTTDNGVDSWFIGYIPQKRIVTGIWLGNKERPHTEASGSDAAALWGETMKSYFTPNINDHNSLFKNGKL